MFSLIATVDMQNNLDVGRFIPWMGITNLAFFREKTRNSLIIMGRKTWDSLLHKPMPNHINIVLSKTLKMRNLENELFDKEGVYDLKSPDNKYNMHYFNVDYLNNADNRVWEPRTNKNPDYIFSSIRDLLEWIEQPDISEKYKFFNKFVIGGCSTFNYFLHKKLISSCYITHMNILICNADEQKNKKLNLEYILDIATSYIIYSFIVDNIPIKIMRYIMLKDIIKSSKHLISSPIMAPLKIQSPSCSKNIDAPMPEFTL